MEVIKETHLFQEKFLRINLLMIKFANLFLNFIKKILFPIYF